MKHLNQKQCKKTHRKNVKSDITALPDHKSLHFKSVMQPKCDIKLIKSPKNLQEKGFADVSKSFKTKVLSEKRNIAFKKKHFQEYQYTPLWNKNTIQAKNKLLNNYLKSMDDCKEISERLQKKMLLKQSTKSSERKTMKNKIDSEKVSNKIIKLILNKKGQKKIKINELKQLISYIVKDETQKNAMQQQRIFKQSVILLKKSREQEFPLSKLTSIRSINNSTYDLMAIDDHQMQCFKKPKDTISNLVQQKNIEKQYYSIDQIHNLQTYNVNFRQKSQQSIKSQREYQSSKQTMNIISSYLSNDLKINKQQIIAKSSFKNQHKAKYTLVKKSNLIQIQKQQQNEKSFQQEQSFCEYNSDKNIKIILKALLTRQKRLIEKRNSQMNNLQIKLEKQIINQQQFIAENKKILLLTDQEISQIQNIIAQITQGRKKLKYLLQSQDKDRPNLCQKNINSNLSQKCLKILNQNQVNNQGSEEKDQVIDLMNSFHKINQVLYNSPENENNSDKTNSEYNLSPCTIDKNQDNKIKKRDYLQKLKSLDNSKIDNILQFIFTDLCLQLYIDNEKNIKFVEKFQKNTQQLRKLKLRKGVNLQITKIKQFLSKFFIFYEELETQSNFLINLKNHLGPTGVQYQLDIEQCYKQDDLESVISNKIFQLFFKVWSPSSEIQPFYKNQIIEQKRILFLGQCLEVFYKSVFDCINEHLDNKRSFGRQGKQFPWKSVAKFDIKRSYKQKKEILKEVCKMVIKDASFFCGVMLDKEENINMGKNYLQEIREDRLSRMLGDQLFENDFRWLFYDDDEAEILMQLTKTIEMLIIFEFSLEIYKIAFK